MKKTTFIIMALHMASASLLANETNALQEARRLVEQVRDVRSDMSTNATYFIDGYRWWGRSSEMAQLNNMVSKYWRDIVENVVEVAPTEVDQVVLFMSFATLQDAHTLDCFDKMANLCLNNTINKDVFNSVIMAYDTHTTPRHRLSYNYKNPTIMEIFRKAKVFDPERSEYYDKLLSGDTRRGLQEFYRNGGDGQTRWHWWWWFALPAAAGAWLLLRAKRKRK